MSSILILLFLVSFTFASISFKSVSISATASNLRYRSLNFFQLFLGLFNGAAYNSLQVDIDTKNLTVDGDFIWGAFYVGSGTPPVQWHGYWNAHVEIDRNLTNNTNFANFSNFNVSSSSSFIITSYFEIVEKNSTGGIVGIYPLNKIWSYNVIESRDQTNASIGLYSAVFDGIVSIGKRVKIQYIATEYTGVIDMLDGVPVYPKAIETIFYIINWDYKNNSNTLTLRIAVGSAQFSASANGQIKSGTGIDQVYFRAASTAFFIASGKTNSVSVAVLSSKNFTAIGFPDLAAQLQLRYGAQASLNIYEITFPPGALNIAYDPTIGAGESPYDESSNGWIIALIVCVLVGLVLIGVAIVAFFTFRRRTNYNAI